MVASQLRISLQKQNTARMFNYAYVNNFTRRAYSRHVIKVRTFAYKGIYLTAVLYAMYILHGAQTKFASLHPSKS
jgi:hypothetical protein